MSVICSNSDDSSDQDPVALQCTASLSGMRCYKPCYLPSLPVFPNSYTKLRPLPTGSSTPTEPKTVEPTAAYILSSCEHLKSMGTKDGRVLSEQSKATSSPVAGQLPTSPNLGHVNIKAATDGDNEVLEAKPECGQHIDTTTNTINRSEDGDTIVTDTQSIYLSQCKNESYAYPSHASMSTPRRAAVKSPVNQSPRKRRKKSRNPLPPYGALMKDMSDDDIARYSSDDADAIRSKSSFMLQNLHQAKLEAHYSKIDNIEMWRKESTGDI